MSSSLTALDLVTYLRSHGWRLESRGAIGQLWARGARTVGVPDGLSADDAEWQSVIRRVGLAMDQSVESVSRALSLLWQDVIEFTAPGSSQPELRLGARLYACAYTAFRSSATTALTNRGFLRGMYSPVGDRLLESARFDQSRPGSYVVPVIVDLDRPTSDEEDRLPLTTPHEPRQRRLTRTLQESLVAIDTLVIQPEHEPRKRDLAALVSTGVSRELVQAISGVTETLEEGSLNVSTVWATTIAHPKVATDVAIPKDATSRLRIVADFLRSETKSRSENVSGPIVGMDDDAHSPGSVIIQAVRFGRTCRVRVHLDLEQTKQAHRWFDSHETVIANGAITSVPGDHPAMHPDSIMPLSDVLLLK